MNNPSGRRLRKRASSSFRRIMPQVVSSTPESLEASTVEMRVPGSSRNMFLRRFTARSRPRMLCKDLPPDYRPGNVCTAESAVERPQSGHFQTRSSVADHYASCVEAERKVFARFYCVESPPHGASGCRFAQYQ
jgi:hypothetical protein